VGEVGERLQSLGGACLVDAVQEMKLQPENFLPGSLFTTMRRPANFSVERMAARRSFADSGVWCPAPSLTSTLGKKQ